MHRSAIIVLIGAAITAITYAWFCWSDPDFRRSEWRYYTFRDFGFGRIKKYPMKFLLLFAIFGSAIVLSRYLDALEDAGWIVN